MSCRISESISISCSACFAQDYAPLLCSIALEGEKCVGNADCLSGLVSADENGTVGLQVQIMHSPASPCQIAINMSLAHVLHAHWHW